MKANSKVPWEMEHTNKRPRMRNAAQVFDEEASSKIQKEKRRELMLGSITLQSIRKSVLAIHNDQTMQITLHQG